MKKINIARFINIQIMLAFSIFLIFIFHISGCNKTNTKYSIILIKSVNLKNKAINIENISGIACIDKIIYALDTNSGSVYKLDIEKDDYKVLLGKLESPVGITASKEKNIVVSDLNSFIKSKIDGSIIRKETIKATNPNKIFPLYNSLSYCGEYLVAADMVNKRIDIFDKNFKYCYTFGSNGENKGEFTEIAGLTTIGNKIYVADSSTVNAFEGKSVIEDKHNVARIQIFNIKGEYLNSWGKRSKEKQDFRYINSICTNGEDVFVADNSKINVYTEQGAYRESIYFPTEKLDDLFLCETIDKDVIVFEKSTKKIFKIVGQNTVQH